MACVCVDVHVCINPFTFIQKAIDHFTAECMHSHAANYIHHKKLCPVGYNKHPPVL